MLAKLIYKIFDIQITLYPNLFRGIDVAAYTAIVIEGRKDIV